MPPLARHASHTSVLSNISVDSASSAASSDAIVSFSSASGALDGATVRRRPTPGQLNTLQSTFDDKPYLSRQERIGLAQEIGMELKAVTAWFQNRRQAAKRVAGPRKSSHTSPLHTLPPISDPAPRGLRATASLDHFATRAEKPERSIRPHRQRSFPLPPMLDALASTAAAPSIPRTPRRVRISTTAPRELWQLIPSSPGGPSSPAREQRLHEHSNNGHDLRAFRSLEDACANASRDPIRDDSETEDDEPRTTIPQFGRLVIPAGAVDLRRTAKHEKENTPFDCERTPVSKEKGEHRAREEQKDVEAAMVLIAFRTSPRG